MEFQHIACNRQDYLNMYALTLEEYSKNIIEFYPKGSSFNAEQAKLGFHVVSCDPLYALSPDKLKVHFTNILQQNLATVSEHPEHFTKPGAWLRAHMEEVYENFIQDYALAQNDRYVAMTLENLPRVSKMFDLMLIHDFFHYIQISSDELVTLLQQALRLVPEIRLFSVVDKSGETSALLAPLLLLLQQAGYGVELRKVNFEWQKGNHVLLRLWVQQCNV